MKLLLGRRNIITFKSIAQILTPHLVLLEIYAAIICSFYMTTIAEKIKDVHRDWQIVNCIASNKSSNVAYFLIIF